VSEQVVGDVVEMPAHRGGGYVGIAVAEGVDGGCVFVVAAATAFGREVRRSGCPSPGGVRALEVVAGAATMEVRHGSFCRRSILAG
jgi:hypothetical protein